MTNRASKPLGFWPVLALVVGNMVGSGIYLLPATLAPFGTNATLGWMATIAGAMCLAFIFARLAHAMPVAGGPYAFVNAAFGPVAGFATAWSYWTLLWAGNAAVAIAVISAISLILPGLEAYAAPASLVLIWSVVLVNVRGVALAGRVQLVTAALKLVPLVGVILLALWLLNTQGGEAIVPNPAVPITGGAIAGAAALTFWGFLGVESATVPADRITNAARVVPFATILGTFLTGAVYLAVSLALTTMMPAAEAAASPSPIATFLGRTFGNGTAVVVAAFAAIAALGALNGFTLLQGEICAAMARGGVFPAWLGKQSSRGTPARAHIVSGVLVTVVTLTNYTRGMGDLFAFIASVSLAAGMLAYFASACAAIKLLPGDRPAVIVAAIGAAFVAWLSWGLGAEANAWALILLLAGAPVYLLVRRAAASGR